MYESIQRVKLNRLQHQVRHHGKSVFIRMALIEGFGHTLSTKL